MKLRNGFITYNSGSEQIMVAAGNASDVFRGMVRSNATAAFIIDCLGQEISREALADTLVARYDAPREIIERDFMHHFGFLPDAIYDYDLPVAQRKPDPYALTDIMDRFGLKPEELLMVDDMKLGYTMAKAVDVPTAFAGWSKAEFPELTSEMRSLCDYSFVSAGELETFLFEEK